MVKNEELSTPTEEVVPFVQRPKRPPLRLDFRHLALAAAIATFLSVLLGYVLRFNPSGAACPDWPTCYGQTIFPAGLVAQLDMLHRITAGLAALGTLAAMLWALLRPKTGRMERGMLVAASISMILQVVLGRSLVIARTSALLSPLHLALALLALAFTTMAATAGFLAASPNEYRSKLAYKTPFARLVLAAGVGVFTLMISGALVTNLQAGAACSGFPFCDGGLPQSGLGWLAFTHRLLTLAVTFLVLAVFLRAWRARYEQLVELAGATAAGALFAGQVLVGALKVVRAFPVDLVGLHAALTAALWLSFSLLITATGLSRVNAEDEALAALAQRPELKARLKAFFNLNKPIIVALLLVTTYAGMVVGGKQVPGLEVTLWTLLGGALAAGGASALNQYIDRSADSAMQRTSSRPLPSGVLTPAEGLAYGIGACLVAFFLLAGFVNLLAAVLSFAGMIYYVLIYSIWLKYCHRPEYRHRGWGRGNSTPGRMGGRDRQLERAIAVLICPGFHVDAAAFLGPGPGAPQGLRPGRRAYAAGGQRRT